MEEDDELAGGERGKIARSGWEDNKKTSNANTLLLTVWTVWKEQEMAEQQKRLQAEADLKAQRKSIAEEIRKQRLGESSS